MGWNRFVRPFQSLQGKFLVGMFCSGLVLIFLTLLFAVSWRYNQVSVTPVLYVAVILSVLALVVPGLLIHRGIVRRLRSIIETTKQVAGGDLSARVEIEVHDEIGELGEAFNEMTARVGDTIREIRENRDFNETILNSIEHGIVVIDERFRVITANRSYFDGNPSLESVLGRYCFELHRHDHDCKLTCPAGVTFREGVSARDVHKHICEDGSEKVMEVFSSPIRGPDGRVRMVILVSKDVTRRMAMESRLMRADKMALVGQMASGLAHEIKNPIAGISAAIQVISKSMEADDPNREIFEEIQQQIDRMKRTLSDLLSYAKPKRPNLERQDANHIVRKTLALMEHKARSQGIVIRQDLQDGMPPVWLDADMIQQVLLNLLLNAIQAQPEGGEILVRATCDQDETSVKIIVEDRGPGMSPETREKIFDPFFTTKHTGTGLGLTICQQIIEDHDGVLSIESTPGKGTSCKIVLPVEALGDGASGTMSGLERRLTGGTDGAKDDTIRHEGR